MEITDIGGLRDALGFIAILLVVIAVAFAVNR